MNRNDTQAHSWRAVVGGLLHQHVRIAVALAGSITVAVLLASASSAAMPMTMYPLTIDNCGQKITFTKAPSRVVLLYGASVGEAESFIALGLQKTIVANAQSYGFSDAPGYAAQVAKLPTGGVKLNKNYDIPAEQTLSLKPDLVVSTWYGGFDGKSGFATRAQLAKAGANALVNPDNCANGKPDATAAEKATYANRTVASSYRFLTLLGQIFNVQEKAATVISGIKARIAAVEAKVAGKPRPHVLIAFPGMSMMNTNGLPAVFGGGIFDDVVKAAGGVNSFQGLTDDAARTLNKEALASAKVDVLVVGLYLPNENAKAYANQLFAAYPQWAASKTKTWTYASDGLYMGPLNAYAIEKIAKVAHP